LQIEIIAKRRGSDHSLSPVSPAFATYSFAPRAPITSPSTTTGSPPCISMKPRAVIAAKRPWLIASSSAWVGFLKRRCRPRP